MFTSSRPSPLLTELPEVRELFAVSGAGTSESADPAGAAVSEVVGRLRDSSPAERHRIAMELVRSQAATVLGHEGAASVPASVPFSDLGIDSLTAVEIRNRLTAATGTPLPPTLVFDCPTPTALAEFLVTEVCGAGDAEPDADPAEERIRRALAAVPLSRLRDAGLLDSLLGLLDPDEPAAAQEDGADAGSIDAMDVDSLIQTALGNADS